MSSSEGTNAKVPAVEANTAPAAGAVAAPVSPRQAPAATAEPVAIASREASVCELRHNFDDETSWLVANGLPSMGMTPGKLPPVRFIIDAECFFVAKRQLIKELGILDALTGENYCRYFRVGNFRDLCDADRQQAVWVKNHVHGLKFVDLPGDEPQEAIGSLVRNLNELANGNLIAYKGGSVERNLLEQHGVPHVNLESFGCPQFHEIAEQHPSWYSSENQCSRHVTRNRRRDRPEQRLTHCPLTENMCFYRWMSHYRPDALVQ